MEEVEFTVKCKMDERWVPTFMKMLKTMEHFGDLGHSEFVGLFSDGDGDFRPAFETDIKYNKDDTHTLERQIYNYKFKEKYGYDCCMNYGTFYDAG